MDQALLESLTMLLGAQYVPATGTWNVMFIAPNSQFKMQSYAVGVTNHNPMQSPTVKDALAALAAAGGDRPATIEL